MINVFGFQIQQIITCIIIIGHAQLTKGKCKLELNPACPDGIYKDFRLKGSCLKVLETAKSWKDAKTYCNNNNMDVVEPMPMGAANAVHKYARQSNLDSYWIGITYDEKRKIAVTVKEGVNVSQGQGKPYETAARISGKEDCVMADATLTTLEWFIVNCSQPYQVLCESKPLNTSDRPDVLKYNHDLTELTEGTTLEITCAADLRAVGQMELFLAPGINRRPTFFTSLQKVTVDENLRSDGICVSRFVGHWRIKLTLNMNGSFIRCSSSTSCSAFDRSCLWSEKLIVGKVKPDPPRIEILSENAAFSHLDKGTDLVVECSAHLRKQDEIKFALISDSKVEIIKRDDKRLKYNETTTVKKDVNPMYDRHGVAQLTLALTPDVEGKTLACLSHYNESEAGVCGHGDIACKVAGTIRYRYGEILFGVPFWMLLVILAVLLITTTVFALLLKKFKRGEIIQLGIGEAEEHVDETDQISKASHISASSSTKKSATKSSTGKPSSRAEVEPSSKSGVSDGHS